MDPRILRPEDLCSSEDLRLPMDWEDGKKEESSAGKMDQKWDKRAETAWKVKNAACLMKYLDTRGTAGILTAFY